MSQPSGSRGICCPYCGETYRRTNWMKRYGFYDYAGNLLGDTHLIACARKHGKARPKKGKEKRMMETIAVHASTEESSPIVKFVRVESLPADVQAIVENGDAYGAHVEDGKVVVRDVWGDLHDTGIAA